jgi:HSP20 family protein
MFAIQRSTGSAPSDLQSVSNRIARLFDEAFRGWPTMLTEPDGSLVAAWIPPVDVTEEADAVKITIELPGVRPEDVQLSLENNLLTIRGEKRQASQQGADRVHRYERTYGAFERTFTIPSSVDGDHVRATYENGVLTVTLPKVERARPRRINVEVQKA